MASTSSNTMISNKKEDDKDTTEEKKPLKIRKLEATPTINAKTTILQKPKTKLRKIGFCGVDDSVSPHLLGLICQSYPFVEFGVLFRPGKEGEPRFASNEWVEKLSKVALASNGKMTMAAHLCGSRVQEILNGKDEFVSTLYDKGFRRVQINATVVNGVDTSNLCNCAATVQKIITKHQNIEFIIQKNDETQLFIDKILDIGLPFNVTMLYDESKGFGVLPNRWPTPPPTEYNVGYAGGIGPSNIRKVLTDVVQLAGNGRSVWIDMESSLRSIKSDKDVFDLDKCYECICAVCEMGMYAHPSFLPCGG